MNISYPTLYHSQKFMMVVLLCVATSRIPAWGTLLKYAPATNEVFQSNLILVDASISNGSFETGTTGWGAVSGASIAAVTNGPSPASTDGDWSVRVFESGTPTVTSRLDKYRRNIGLDIADGDIFHLSLDYYVPGSNGYNLLVITPLTATNNSAVTVGQAHVISTSGLEDQWVSVDQSWQLDADDGSNGIDFRFEFRRTTGSDATYEGFIDRINILQGSYLTIPEPSTLVLVGFGVAILIRKRFARPSKPRTQDG